MTLGVYKCRLPEVLARRAFTGEERVVARFQDNAGGEVCPSRVTSDDETLNQRCA